MLSATTILMGTFIFRSSNLALATSLPESQLFPQPSLIQLPLQHLAGAFGTVTYPPEAGKSLLLSRTDSQSAVNSPIELPIDLPLSIAQAQTCRPLGAFDNSPIQTLPAPFENGCALYFYYGGNNSAARVYVFRTDANLTELRPVGRSEQELDALVEQGQALKISWFYTNTLGGQRLYGSIPRDRAFLDQGTICMWMGRTVVCLEAATLRPRQIETILRTNKQQWESRDS